MSQQKILLAACLVACLVALVAAQSFDPARCTQSAQNLLNGYSKKLQGIVREMTQSLSNQGTSAINLEGFSYDANKLVEQITSLADTERGFDAQRLVKTYYDIIQQQLKLGRYFINPSVGLETFKLYMSFSQKLMSANTDLMSSISSACLPSTSSF